MNAMIRQYTLPRTSVAYRVWSRQERWRVPVLMMTLFANACVGEADDATVPGTASGSPGAPVAIEVMPRIEVGVVSGDSVQEFHEVVTPFLLPDGRLVVPLAAAQVIRVFEPDGRYQQTLGGAGDGPGEFARLARAWPRGDTIEAYDNRHRRITRFLPDGSFEVRSLEPAPFSALVIPGFLPDGWVLLGVDAFTPDLRENMVLNRFSATGAHLGEITRVPGLQWQPGSFVGPLSPRAVFAVSHGEIYVADTREPIIQVLGHGGELQRELRWEPIETTSPQAAITAVIDSLLAMAGPSPRPQLIEFVESMGDADRLPAFWDFLIDQEGYVWIRPYDVEAHAVFSPAAGAGRTRARRHLDRPRSFGRPCRVNQRSDGTGVGPGHDRRGGWDSSRCTRRRGSTCPRS